MRKNHTAAGGRIGRRAHAAVRRHCGAGGSVGRPRAPVRGAGQADAIPGEYIVVMKQNAPKGRRRRQAEGTQRGGKVRFAYDSTISGFAARLPARALEALRNNPNVDYIEADQQVALSATQSNPTWGLDRIDQRNLP